MANSMQDKVCVVTGATSGLGLRTAQVLAGMGARLVLVGRSRTRGALAVEIVGNWAKDAGGAKASIYYGDLSVLSEMKRVATDIAAAEPKIDVLINCAGAAFRPRQVTDDGIEKTFALNHLSYFVLGNLLAPRVQAAGAGRIVNVASRAHERSTLDFGDLMFEKNYTGLAAYAKSKLCNILFTRELARRLAGAGVTVNALHPGFVNTRLGDNVGGIARVAIGLMKFFTGKSVEEGAETPVYLASSPEVANITGQYFAKCKVTTPSAAAQDDDAARRLWEESVKLTGVGG